MSNFKKSIIDAVIKSINNEEYVRANIGMDKKSQQTARFTIEYGLSVSITENEDIYVNFHFPKGEYEGIDFSQACLMAGEDRVRRAKQRLEYEKAKYQEFIDATSKNKD